MQSSPINPFEPPRAEPSGTERPLYEVRQIAIATFFGGPIAGAIVMALNYRRLAPDKVTLTIVLGVVASAVILGLAVFLPDDVPNIVLPAAYTAAVAGIASMTQGEAIAQARAIGESRASGWRVAGIALGGLAMMVALVVAVAVVMPQDAVMLGPDQQHEIIYEDGATEQDARALYGVLTEAGYFDDDHPATAIISKENGGWLVTLVLVEGWSDPEMLAYMRDLADRLGTELGGRVRIALADVNLTVHETVDAG